MANVTTIDLTNDDDDNDNNDDAIVVKKESDGDTVPINITHRFIEDVIAHYKKGRKSHRDVSHESKLINEVVVTMRNDHVDEENDIEDAGKDTEGKSEAGSE